jgi:hypothetical protein
VSLSKSGCESSYLGYSVTGAGLVGGEPVEVEALGGMKVHVGEVVEDVD